MLKIEIEGLNNLEAELQSLGSSLGDVLEDAVYAGGLLIANKGAENAPYLSGTLKSATAAPPRIERTDKYRVEGRVGPQGVPYARIQEYGGLTGKGHRTRIQGKFYLTRAVESEKTSVENEMVRAIEEGMNW